MGKTIKIYLVDGTVTGIRHGEIVNWTGQAIACPRTRFGDLKELAEVRRPGVYCLFGTDDDGREVVYIGEAEVVVDRISTHISGKEFWSELVAFTSKDDNLTKAHVRYLEARLVELATRAGRYLIKNAASPQLPALPRSDRDAMEDFIEGIRTLLGVLGYRALEPLTLRQSPAVTSVSPPPPAPISRAESSSFPTNFYLKVGGITASAIRTDEGIVVLAGSEVRREVQSHLSPRYRSLRDQLIASGVIQETNGKLKFSRDYLFSSPSQAAVVLLGSSTNGRKEWRTIDGQTWGELDDIIAEQLLRELGASRE